ncbi:hypothetical protein B0H11DRAFT_336098 [Mycena galericulata]|nr:hypothetical protein B0H11DRAFT_336098 [Mycena galericulata]
MHFRWTPGQLPRARSFHTTPPTQARYRGPARHGTLQEWAMRILHKDVKKWSTRSRRVAPAALALLREADSIVAREQREAEERAYAPRGEALWLMETADALLKQLPFEALEARDREREAPPHVWLTGEEEEAHRRGRLREALRLYYRAAQRANGTMPVIGSRIWGTTRVLERRILRTEDRLYKAELRAFGQKEVVRDETGWGVRMKERERREGKGSKGWPVLTKPDKQTTKPKDGLELKYKSPGTLPPLRRLPPSAVERARMPLLQAFPGVGTVGDTSLSIGHALFSAAGFLGTHPTSSPSSNEAHEADNYDAEPDTPHTPPTGPLGSTLRWVKVRRRNTLLAAAYFRTAPAPRRPPPLALGSPSASSLSTPNSDSKSTPLESESNFSSRTPTPTDPTLSARLAARPRPRHPQSQSQSTDRTRAPPPHLELAYRARERAEQ